MARKELTVVSFISIDGAPEVRFDSLSDEQRQYAVGKAMERVGEAVERYVNAYPEEAYKFLSKQTIIDE